MTMKEKVIGTLTSRKFWLAVLSTGGCVAAAYQDGNISLNELLVCLAPLQTWAAGEAYIDGKRVEASRVSQTTPAQ